MKLFGSKKAHAVLDLIILRDYGDFAQMVLTDPSWNTDQGV